MSINKLISISQLKKKLFFYKKNKVKISFTNGCFDILHSGHIKLLINSKKKNHALIVAVNSDSSYFRNKKKKPRFSFNKRVEILSQIVSVDNIVKQSNENPINLIRLIKPNIHCKGGDYKAKDLKEYNLLTKMKTKIFIMPIKGHKISSSKIKL